MQKKTSPVSLLKADSMAAGLKLAVKRVGKYQLEETIGEGTYGKVKRAINVEDNSTVAIKILDKQSLVQNDMIDNVKREINVLRMLHHKNVVGLIDVLSSKTSLYLVMELIKGGELFHRLSTRGRFSEDESRRFFTQLVQGVAYCHEHGIVHRDLKPENLLLTEFDELKITDFGLAAMTEDGKKRLLDTACGTVQYMAPEVLQGDTYEGRAVDMWSMGVILYVFLAGRVPVEEDNEKLLLDRILRSDFDFPAWIAPPARDLILGLLRVDPLSRFTMSDVLAHPWMMMASEPVSVTAHPSHISLSAPILEIKEKTIPRLARDSAFNKSFDNIVEEVLPVSKPPTGVPTITAFDIILLSGALDLTRLVADSKTPKVPSNDLKSSRASVSPTLMPSSPRLAAQPAPGLPNNVVSSNYGLRKSKSESGSESESEDSVGSPPGDFLLGGVLRALDDAESTAVATGHLSGSAAHTSFIIEMVEPEEVLAKLSEVASSFHYPKVQFQCNTEQYRLRIRAGYNIGAVTMNVQVYRMASRLFLCHCTRFSGDLMQFVKFYQQFRDRVKGVNQASGSSHNLQRTRGREGGLSSSAFRSTEAPTSPKEDAKRAMMKGNMQSKSQEELPKSDTVTKQVPPGNTEWVNDEFSSKKG